MKVQFKILPLVAPSCQSIAPPLTEAELFSKLHLANSPSCEFSKNTAPPNPSITVKLVTELCVKLLSKILVTLPAIYTAPPFTAVFSSNVESEILTLLPSM